MDPGTILAIVSLALQVIKLADAVIESFERLKNAPQELRDFRQAVVRLQRHLEALQTDVSSLPSGDILHEDDLHEIEETLTLCKDLLQQQVNPQKNPVVTSVIRGVWTFRNNQKLAKYKTRIDAHYTQILVPGWLRSLSARNAPNPPLLLDDDDHTSAVTETYNNTPLDTPQYLSPSKYQVAPEHLQHITEKLEKLKTADDKEATEQTLRSIDYELRTCWSELGLVDEDVDDLIEYPIPNIKRRSTLSYEDAPTTLELESAPQQHRRLHLRRLHIMARDDESRILQYQNADCTIHVTHVVPYGSIPWTLNPSSKKVSFLKKHLVTVVDSEGYHIYRLDPKYKFKDHEACDRFQSTLRERELRGAFDAVELKVNGRIVARRQMVRFWHRAERDGTMTNTITYYISSGTSAGEHDEINLTELQASVKHPRSRRISRDPGKRIESNSIDIMPSQQGSKQLHIKFDTDEEARQFTERFTAMQNSGFSQPPSLLGGSSTRAESTLVRTPVMGPNISTVPIIALDLDSQDGLYQEWNTVFDPGNNKT